MLKEVHFEVRGDPKAANLACILRSETLVSEAINANINGDHAWELNLVRGSEREVAGFRSVLQEPQVHPVASRVHEVQAGATWVVYFWEWRRPAPGEGISVHHLAHDLLGGRGAVRHRVSPGKGEFTVLGFDCDALGRLFREVEAAFAGTYEVRLVRMGEPRLAPGGDEGMGLADLLLARQAMGLGYFEEPRRIGVRGLSALLGTGKSATAHRLRRIERQAVAHLLESTMGSAAKTCEAELRAARLRLPPADGPEVEAGGAS